MECYYCGRELLEPDIVIEKVPLWGGGSKPRFYKRKFHKECLDIYLEETKDKKVKAEEAEDWSEVYYFFRDKILQTKKMPPHAVKRLLGLRVGKYIPNGNNTRIIKRGYSFKTILTTLKYCKRLTDKATQTVKFKNEKHKIDYLMVIVANNIDFIQERLEKVERQNRRVEKIKQEGTNNKPMRKYVRKGGGMNRFDWVD
ncbi:hypothetical protein [Limosilactobacillus reuteri]|uniref:hypothetical protein n=1 Tax=Limosilactobacillus reuteri TaxID=1598 RepID=UPI001E4610B3|nr:hypothetical protein [Limosilactobacillus reuteri]MCC4466439.1 hypothetical protein [Limosilactobacillus reuteri]MCC4474215.1 hypothetical protein [Limosilactobacillus reuteri]